MSEPSLTEFPKLQMYLKGVQNSSKTATRAKVKVRDFCYASLTGVLKRFQKDWKFIRACVVVNPKDEVMLETKPHVAEYINEIFDFVKYFGRFGPEYRRVIEAEAARFYRDRRRYPEFIGMPDVRKMTRAQKENTELLVPQDPKRNISLWFQRLKDEEPLLKNFADLTQILLRILPTQVLCETSFSFHNTYKDVNANRYKDENVVSEMFLGNVPGDLDKLDFNA